MSKEIFNLEHQYQQYLKLTKLDENKMSTIQASETKRAFMGACGQIILLFTNDIPDLPEDEAMDTITSMRNQVAEYWHRQNNRQN